MEQIQDNVLTIVFASLFLLIFFVGFLTFTIFYFKKFYRLQTERNALKLQHEETLNKVELEIKEQTLQHLAAELHDNLGQMASLIKINLNTITWEDVPKAKAKIEDTKELTRQLITDIKLLSASLNGIRITQIGLVKGLEGEVDRLNKTDLFTASLHCPEPLPELNEATTIILFRMAQEMLNNAVKHSGADCIKILMTKTNDLLTLEILDNGKGFNFSEKIKSGGSGLLNLQSRAKLIHARVSVQSSVGKGTTISIELPLIQQDAFTNNATA